MLLFSPARNISPHGRFIMTEIAQRRLPLRTSRRRKAVEFLGSLL
jgi:hypothetical protein